MIIKEFVGFVKEEPLIMSIATIVVLVVGLVVWYAVSIENKFINACIARNGLVMLTVDESLICVNKLSVIPIGD